MLKHSPHSGRFSTSVCVYICVPLFFLSCIYFSCFQYLTFTSNAALNLYLYIKYGEYFCRISCHNQDGWINREAHYKSCSHFKSYSITWESLGQMSVILTGVGKRKKSFSGKGNDIGQSSVHVWRMNKPLWWWGGCVVWMEAGGHMVER